MMEENFNLNDRIGNSKYTMETLIDDCARFLKNRHWDDMLRFINEYPGQKSMYISFKKLIRHGFDFGNVMIDFPNEMFEAMRIALIEKIDFPIDVDISGATVRIKEFGQNKISIHAFRETNIEQLVSVEGIVRKATNVEAIYAKTAYQCLRCGHVTLVPQSSIAYVENRMEEPYGGCEEETCGKRGPFKIRNRLSSFVDFQRIQLQEPPETIQNGGQPQSLEVVIVGDIAGDVVPGNRIIITGILNAINLTNKDGKTVACKYVLYANYIEHIDKGFQEVEISPDEEREILEMSQDPDLFDKLVASVAPSIYGYEDIKLAILLQLFSGVPKITVDGSWLRGDIHIMLIGDPGIAKSQLLRYVLRIAPRANFSTGLGSTKAGLTASAVKDELKNGAWTIEAGVLPMTNEGIVCADEMDKMREEDRSGLHEAMEQQTVTISKAGLIMTLSAKCSVLAAANPKYGRFDEYEGLADQINMPPALLSRFDLIYVLQDKPNEALDTKIANHILNIHRSGSKARITNSTLPGYSDPDPLMVKLFESCAPPKPHDGEVKEYGSPVIETEFMRKYIAYARKKVFPQINQEAHALLLDFYISLRKNNYGASGNKNPISITARQMEGMIRLTEAVARVRLKPEASAEDAKVAISIIHDSLRNVGMDSENGQIDIDSVLVGRKTSLKDKIKLIMDLMDGYMKDHQTREVPLVYVVEGLVDAGISEKDAAEHISRLLRDGKLFRKGEEE